MKIEFILVCIFTLQQLQFNKLIVSPNNRYNNNDDNNNNNNNNNNNVCATFPSHTC